MVSVPPANPIYFAVSLLHLQIHSFMKNIFLFPLKSVFLIILFSVLLPISAHANMDKWEYIDTYEGVALYQAREEEEGLLPFMASAELNIPFQQIVMALVNAERKHIWAPKLKSSTIHSEPSSNHFEFSEFYTTPWPFEDREFLLMGSVQYEQDRVLFSAVNSNNKALANTDHTLANVEILDFVIIPLSETRSRVKFIFSGDMGGWIPDFVKTIIQKKWPVRFIQALQAHINEDQDLDSNRYQSLEKGKVPFLQKSSQP